MLRKHCIRCTNFMLEEEITLGSESSERKLLLAYHCMYCGRIEYATAADMTTDQPSSY